MKKVSVVRVEEVEVRSFVVNDFIQTAEHKYTVEKVSKKELKYVAEEIGLVYSEKEIQSIKKLLEAYLAKRIEER